MYTPIIKKAILSQSSINHQAMKKQGTLQIKLQDSIERPVCRHSQSSSVGCACHSEPKGRMRLKYDRSGSISHLSTQGFPVSDRESEVARNSDMKVVPVTGESSSISHDPSLVYHSI
jgi:hypothetical protein